MPSAQKLANYTFDPPLAMVNAVLSNSSVTLTTAPREFPINYTLRIANVADNSASPNLIYPNPTFVSLSSARVILPWNAGGWHYNTNNLDATPEWKNAGFAPGSGWGIGSGLFGTDSSSAILAGAPAPISTPLAPNTVAAESEKLVTTYFRKTIDLPALPSDAHYVIGHYTDDGFIAYLDDIHFFGWSYKVLFFYLNFFLCTQSHKL